MQNLYNMRIKISAAVTVYVIANQRHEKRMNGLEGFIKELVDMNVL